MAYPDGPTILAELARDLGAETLRFAVDQFVQDAADLVARVEERHAAGDCTGVQRAAHALKGLFRQFGAPEVADVAASLDRNPQAGGPGAAALVDRLRRESRVAVTRVQADAEALLRAAR